MKTTSSGSIKFSADLLWIPILKNVVDKADFRLSTDNQCITNRKHARKPDQPSTQLT